MAEMSQLPLKTGSPSEVIPREEQREDSGLTHSGGRTAAGAVLLASR